MNQGSIDRGSFSGSKFTYYYSELEDSKEKFGIPDLNQTVHTKDGDYTLLTKFGYVNKGTIINMGDVIIGKYAILPKDYDPNNKYQDKSTVYKDEETAVVHNVIYDRNSEGKRFIKIGLRKLRGVTVGDKFCRFGSAEVLTDRGWISFQNITLNHKVATLKEGKYIDYVNPIQKYKFDHKGDMYYLKTQQIETTCTLNHKLYVKKRDHKNFELIEAKNAMGKRVRFKKDGIINTPDLEKLEFDINNHIVGYNTNWFLQLLGMFISYGFVNSHSMKIICFKQRKIDYNIKICENLNIRFNKSKDGIYISDKDICEIFRPWSICAINKYLPDFVWKLNTTQSRILLNVLIEGDGSKNNNGSVCYYTSSIKLANDVQRLALHAGWSGTIKIIRPAGYESIIAGRKTCSTVDTVSVRIVKSKNNPQINHGHIHEQKIQEEKIIQYEGKVYCIEVPDTHLYYCRENQYSPPMWDGNSSRAG